MLHEEQEEHPRNVVDDDASLVEDADKYMHRSHDRQ